jgi:hypothetical protein
MTDLLASLLRSAPFSPLARVEAFKRDPVGVQSHLLRRLLITAADTEWGRRFDFRRIAASDDVVEAYRRTVPLHSYDALSHDAERVRRGVPDVMWPGIHTHFAVSSGTASAGKLIPLSQEMLDVNKRFSVGAGLNYLAETGDFSFIFGKHLTLPGRIEESPDYPGTLVGEVSGLQAEHAPKFFSTLLQAVPNELSFLPNWEEKLAAVADHTMEQDVRLIVMVPTWSLSFFAILFERYRKRTGRQVSTVGEIWPNLRVFISGGVALRSYKELLRERIGIADLSFVETYGASEGFFSFQDKLDDPAMLLHLDNGVFYEFVPMDNVADEDPPRLHIGEVEPDVRYALYVSTCSGLWAYGVGDVLRFSSTSPHRIFVAGRTSEMVDRFGEAVFGEEARAALRAACELTGARVRDFHIAPRLPQQDVLAAHEWLIEFETPPGDLGIFADAIDEHLQRVNRHYQIRREARSFDLPIITPLRRGAFYDWLKSTKGSVSSQTKVPRMSEEREIADGVLSLNNNGESG